MTSSWSIGAALAMTLYAAAAQAQCAGDCNRDGHVSVDELVLGSQIALGREQMSACPELDADASGSVEIDELVDGVASAVRHCSDPTPATSPTPAPSPTLPSTVTVTPFVPIKTMTPTPSPNPTGPTPTRTQTPTSLPTGSIDRNPRGAFRQVQVSAQGATRLTLLTLEWLRLVDQIDELALPDGEAFGACDEEPVALCTVSDGTSSRTIAYPGCESETASGHRVRRTGQISQTVSNETFCLDETVGLEDTTSLAVTGYHQREETLGGTVVAEVNADLRIIRTGLGVQGCSGRDVVERIEGTFHVECTPEAESVDCPARGADLTLDLRGLERVIRSSQGGLCKRTTAVTGQWLVENNATGESFPQSFDGFTVAQQAAPGGSGVAITVSGDFAANCLGAVSIPTSAFFFGDEAMCPSSGSIAMLRPGSAPDLEGAGTTVDFVRESPPLLRGEDGGEVKTDALASTPVVDVSEAGSREPSSRNKAVEDLSPHASPLLEQTVDFLRDGPSRRRQNTAAPQGERKKLFEINDNTVRAEEAPLLRGRLEAPFAHLSTVSEGEGAEPAGEGFEQRLFRSANGQVYQVLQFDAGPGENGAEAIKVTTVVGSLGGSVPGCFNTTGDEIPTAVTAVRAGRAFNPAAVFKSPILGQVENLCFNANSAGGNGSVCVGAECAADCHCVDEANCSTFSLGGDGSERTPITVATVEGGGIPGARVAVLDAPFSPCGDFAGREAYAFDAVSSPTTEQALCSAPPTDGFTLPNGSTIVFAYEAKALELFNAGAAGLLIDAGGSSPCDTFPGVLSPGQVTVDTAFAPRAEFKQGNLVFRYADDPQNSQQVPDAAVEGCETDILIQCEQPPTPTPTPGAERPCGAVALEAAPIEGTMQGRVSNETGWCGLPTGNRDVVYELTAPEAGIYVVQVRNATFDPILYARKGQCRGAAVSGACSKDPSEGVRDRDLELQLSAGERVAIVVDGGRRDSDRFELTTRIRRPDLVVRAGSVLVNPGSINAGGSVTASATIENLGDADAGPFAVDFFLARDTAGIEPVSAVPVRVFVTEGLAAGASRSVILPNPFPIPLIAAQEIFLVASADGFSVIAESNEANNASGVPISISSAPGAVLEQREFRAEDGTVYQVLQAIPTSDPDGDPRAARQFRIATIAASLGTVETCETGATTPGAPLGAAAATAELVDLAAVRRSGILRPNTFNVPSLDTSRAGTLRFGTGGGAIEVCADDSRCAGAPLVPITQSGDRPPAACAARLPSGSYCTGVDAPATIAFGIDSTDGVCDRPADVSVQTPACFGLATVRGFDLFPGEAVVFVYEPGREAFAIGSGAFGLAHSAANPAGCAAGQVSSTQAEKTQFSRTPQLAFRQAVMLGGGGVQGLDSATSVTVSPDGANVYVASAADSAVAVFSRTAAGTLTFEQVVRDGEGGVQGILFPRSVTVSRDGANVYVASFGESAVAVFTRTATGTLSFEQVVRNGEGGVQGLGGATTVTVSPDGANVYVASSLDNAVAVLSRTAAGTLTFKQLVRNGEGGVQGLDGATSVTVSPDGANVYVASSFDRAVAVFSRTAAGTLAFAQVMRNGEGGVQGLDSATSITVSPDGANVYVASFLDSAVVFSRTATGALTFEQVVHNGEDGVHGLDGAQSVTVSPDGANVYIASGLDDAVAVFKRAAAGTLIFEQVVRNGENGVQGLDFAIGVMVSPDGANVYVASAALGEVAVLSRTATGTLTFEQVVRNGEGGVQGLDFATSVTVSPDGTNVYVASFLDSAVAVFSRTAAGTLTFAQVVRDGEGRVQGLAGATDVTVSPDDANVYVASLDGDAVAVFSRTTTGTLTFEQVVRNGEGGVQGLDGAASVTVSPDGANVYVASSLDNAVAVFSRMAAGTLTFAQVMRDGEGGVQGLDGARRVTVSPDGANVYVPSSLDGAVAVFSRTAAGTLTFAQVVRNGEGGVQGLDSASSVTVSPDGSNVYVASFFVGVVVLSRAATGTLTFAQVVRNGEGGVQGLGGAQSVTVSPDGANAYVASFDDDAVAVFSRTAAGTLTFEEVARSGEGGVLGLDGPQSITVSPDGANVYVVSSNDDAVAVFAVTKLQRALSVRHHPYVSSPKPQLAKNVPLPISLTTDFPHQMNAASRN